MKQDWAQEGIQVTLLSQPFDTIISDANQGDPTKWQLDWWGGGWTYEPDYYPTGGGLFGTGSAANYGGYSSSTMDSLIKKTYEPGTASQITARMDAYQAWAVKDLPVIWVPWTPTFSEVATYVHGVNSAFNPIEDLNYPNYWTINH
ncbi:hypothetical protein [Sulfobacillus thermosulfidooxidans]